MPNYFDKFPKVYYNNKIVTDILTRVKINDNYLNNSLLYYDYDVQDKDTPENIADKYYGDSEKHWIILITNNILDPFFEFPLSYDQFNEYVEDKYYEQGLANNMTGLAWSQITIDPNYGYTKSIIIKDSVTEDILSSNTYIINYETYQLTVPQTFTVNLSEGKNVIYEIKRNPLVTIYDTEFNINESKRTIKLLKKEYAQQVVDELTYLMKQQG